MGRLFASTCVATLLAIFIGLVYLRAVGKLSNEKVFRLLAVAHGVDLRPITSGAGLDHVEPTSEQTSFEEIEKRRAVEARHAELKADFLEKDLEKLNRERQLLAQELAEVQQIRQQFQTQLNQLEELATGEGIETQRQIWSKLEPDRAKTQILDMIEAGESDTVVVILSDMPPQNQVKIISEFNPDDPKERVAAEEILRKIRQGLPKMAVVEKARAELKKE
jgi:hypothetical protein